MSLSTDIRRFRVRSGLAASQVLRKLSLDALTGVILRSPVDTGRFRGSWRLSIGQVDSSVEPPRDRLETQLDVGDPPTPQEIAGPTATALSAQIGDTVRLTNSLPYAQPLEDGSSVQAPPNGIVGATVDELARGFAATVRQFEV